MVKKFVIVLGAVFVLFGILGFIPSATPNDLLLNLFAVGTVQNVIHLVSGAAAAAAVLAGNGYPRLYAQVVGIVYGVLAVLGFLGGDGAEVLGLFTVNTASNFLYLAIALAALYAGYSSQQRGSRV